MNSQEFYGIHRNSYEFVGILIHSNRESYWALLSPASPYYVQLGPGPTALLGPNRPGPTRPY